MCYWTPTQHKFLKFQLITSGSILTNDSKNFPNVFVIIPISFTTSLRSPLTYFFHLVERYKWWVDDFQAVASISDVIASLAWLPPPLPHPFDSHRSLLVPPRPPTSHIMNPSQGSRSKARGAVASLGRPSWVTLNQIAPRRSENDLPLHGYPENPLSAFLASFYLHEFTRIFLDKTGLPNGG